ncbi:ubiquitin carboxyl-terminal hydrolase [Tasmannia lanceolata]|uniref:ubiquitin carboxyl-terminal hydrolase n=1 Tax=Tasmannia lanceolata TaxID=3420 RepID=UPI0040641604
MSSFGVLSHIVLLLIFAFIINGAASFHGIFNGSEMKPLVEPGVGTMVLNETRRRLGSFQICAVCTCCGGPKRLCLPSPCCYAINCNIPNRPFGVCSLIPKTCNCFGCHL